MADDQEAPKARRLRFAGRDIPLPQSRGLRIALGVVLVLGGLVGFLPILGFWMVPLGLLVLSVDLAPVRRTRRRILWRAVADPVSAVAPG